MKNEVSAKCDQQKSIKPDTKFTMQDIFEDL